MRRTSTLRLSIIDRSELAKNMYQLLFESLPDYKVEFLDNGDDLADRQRRARPHIVLVNSNAIEKGEDPQFLKDYPAVLIASADRIDLRALVDANDQLSLVTKPFYPYDLITEINAVAAKFHPYKGGAPRAASTVRKRGRRARI